LSKINLTCFLVKTILGVVWYRFYTCHFQANKTKMASKEISHLIVVGNTKIVTYNPTFPYVANDVSKFGCFRPKKNIYNHQFKIAFTLF